LPNGHREFLRRSCILERLSGPLCDHVLDRRGSIQVLTELAHMNVLITPLDRTDTEYRLHPLLAAAFRHDLVPTAPELACTLHARAADWYEQRHDRERAIDHAIESRDTQRAAALIWGDTAPLLAYGHRARLRGRLDRFAREQVASSGPL